MAVALTDQGVVVGGIPIPSSSPVFLSIVAVHVAAGLTCVIAGAIAMLSGKRAGRHPSAGSVYYWSLVVVFVSMTILSNGIRWSDATCRCRPERLTDVPSAHFPGDLVDVTTLPLHVLPAGARAHSS